MVMKRLFIPFCLLPFAASVEATTFERSDREQDSLYWAAMERAECLEQRIDSLDGEAARLRRQFREEPELRDSIGAVILSLERELALGRSERSEVAGTVNRIEQEYLSRGEELPCREPIEHSSKGRFEGVRHRNLIANTCFRETLPSEEYAFLEEAQRYERMASQSIEHYAENYAILLEMQQQLLATTSQSEADSLYDAMQRLEEENVTLDRLLAQTWSRIFDQKSYAYSYLLDAEGRLDLLEQGTARLVEAQRRSEAQRGEYASDALVDYFVQKPALVAWESSLADAFGLVEASDSLRGEAEYLASVEYRLPHLIYERRYLLPYTTIDFASPPKYNSRNPIPECEVYDHGTIYRIRLGSYKYKQQPSIFRGVYPLAYLHEEGRYVYYAGGYATKIEARLAAELLLQRGFKRPEIVRWVDGAKEDVAMDEPETLYRVEISGVQSLGEELKQTIRTVAPEGELARIGGRFVVQSFDDRARAEGVMSAIRQADPSLEVKVVEMKN